MTAVVVGGAVDKRYISDVEVHLPSLGPTSIVQQVSMAAGKRTLLGTPDDLCLLSADPLVTTHQKHLCCLRSILAGQSSTASAHKVAMYKLESIGSTYLGSEMTTSLPSLALPFCENTESSCCLVYE